MEDTEYGTEDTACDLEDTACDLEDTACDLEDTACDLEAAACAAFGTYLRAARERRGLTQRAAAAAAKVSAPYLSQIERGTRNAPSRRVLARLAAVYGVAPEALWERAGAAEAAEAAGLTAAGAARVEWAFQAMLRDPAYRFAGRVRGLGLDVAVQALLVEIYQESTGRQLLTGEELTGEELTGEPKPAGGRDFPD